MPRDLFTGLVFAGTLALLAGCGRADESAPAAAAPSPVTLPASGVIQIPTDSPQLKQIRIEPAQLKVVPVDEVVAPGRVSVNPNRISRVLPPIQGRVLTVMAKLGDFVEQGQSLLTMESPDADTAIATYLQAEANERQARAALTKAEADFRRTSELYEHKAVAEKDLLTAQNDLTQAKATSETTQATRQQAGRKLQLLGLKPNDFQQPFVVHAPISGTVTEINVTPGEYRGATSFHTDTTAPLMIIADLSTVWISSDVPEQFIRLIRVGEPVDITLIAYPGETFSGRVARVASALDPQTRTLKVHVDVPNPKGRFVPEMFGSIRHSGASRSLPVISLAAVVQEYGRSTVFVERAPGQFERRDVIIGPRVGDLVPVLKGVQVGDRVIVDGAVLLKGQ